MKKLDALGPSLETLPATSEEEEYLKASIDPDQGLRNHDYIANIDCFLHRKSGNIYTERALIKRFHGQIPENLTKEEALYTTSCGIRQYDCRKFAPGSAGSFSEDGQLCLNLWKPVDIVPIEGDAEPFLDIVHNFFDQNVIVTKFFLDAIASLIQTPERKLGFMTLFVGDQGIGKSMLCNMLAELVGYHNTAFPTNEAIRSNFTGWLQNAHLIVIHELDKMNREVGTRVKHWVTGQDLLINAKNLPEFYIKNYANVIACSNYDDIAHLDEDDRRMFVWCSQAKKREPEYYSNLYEWFKGDGKGIVLNFLKNRDISDFNPNAAPPRTQGRAQMISNSLTEAQHFLQETLEAHEAPFDRDLCTVREIIKELRAQHVRCTDAEVRQFMRKIRAVSLGQCRIRGTRPNLWAIRNQEYWQTANQAEIAAGYLNNRNQPARLEQVSAAMPIRRSVA